MSSGRWVAVVVALGLLLRLAAILAFPVYPLVDNTADTEMYDAGSRSLAAGDGYLWHGQPTAFFPVGWPLLLSLAYRAAGAAPRTGQFLNLLLSAGLLAAGWGLTRRLYGRRPALLVAAILALAPCQVVYPAFLMSEVAFTGFFLASLWTLAGGTRRALPVVAGGLLMGAATLIRGLALVYPAVVLVQARFAERRSWRGSVAATALFTAALLVPLAPWAVRNHHVFGRWVLVANDGGMNFLMGNHEGATGARHVPAGGLPETGDEVADDREGYRRGFDFIRRRPAEFISLLPRKLVRLTAPGPLLTYRAELLAKWPRPLALGLLGLDQLIHVILWMLAGWTLLAAWRGRTPRPLRAPPPSDPGPPAGSRPAGGVAPLAAAGPGLLLPLAALGLWVAVHLAFLGGARYFFPAWPLLAGLAALAVSGGPRRTAASAASGPAASSASGPAGPSASTV